MFMKVLISLFSLMAVLTSTAQASGTLKNVQGNECAIEIPDELGNSVKFIQALTATGFTPISKGDAAASNYSTTLTYLNLPANKDFDRYETDGAVVTDRAGNVLWSRLDSSGAMPTCDNVKQRLNVAKPECMISVPSGVQTSATWLSTLVRYNFYPQIVNNNPQAFLKLQLIDLEKASKVSAKITDHIPLTLAIATSNRSERGSSEVYGALVEGLFAQLGTCNKVTKVPIPDDPLVLSGKSCKEVVHAIAPDYQMADLQWLCGESTNTLVPGYGAKRVYVACISKQMRGGVLDGNTLSQVCKLEADLAAEGNSCNAQVHRLAPGLTMADLQWLCGESSNTLVRGYGTKPKYVACLVQLMSEGQFDGGVLTSKCKLEADL